MGTPKGFGRTARGVSPGKGAGATRDETPKGVRQNSPGREPREKGLRNARSPAGAKQEIDCAGY
jgi:hypothetical protein